METKEEFIEEAKTKTVLYNADPPPMSDASLQAIQDQRMGKAESKRMAEYKVARKAALAEYKATSGLTKGALFKSFNKAVKSGEVVIPDERTPPRTTWY